MMNVFKAKLKIIANWFIGTPLFVSYKNPIDVANVANIPWLPKLKY
jgi:hypothetical protein